ncbi:MAG: hypothetical protein ACE5H0_11265 [Bacteroidota bacterium]
MKAQSPPAAGIERNPSLMGWISIALALTICLPGWWTKETVGVEKTRYAQRRDKISRKYSPPKMAHTRLRTAGLYKRLGQPVDLSGLTLETPFGEAIEILRNSTEPALNIVVLWKDLRENAFIEASTPIYMQGVSGIPLRKGLELLLMAVSGSPAELGYVVEARPPAARGGIIIIGTKDSLPVKMVTRIYDISDLVARPGFPQSGVPAAYPFDIRAGFARGRIVGPYGGRTGRRVTRGGRGRRIYGRRNGRRIDW